MFRRFQSAVAVNLILLLAFACERDQDCEFLGKCDTSTHTCKCDIGWRGPTCGTLNLVPAPSWGIWPPKEIQTHTDKNGTTTYSWGFSIMQDESGLYHGFVDQGCYNSSDSKQGEVGGTYLLHVVGKTPTGPFSQRDMAFPQTTFNPHIIRSNNGTYVMYLRIGDLHSGYRICNGTLNKEMKRQWKEKHWDDLQANTMDIASSDSLDGPWKVQPIVVQNMKNIHQSNPSGIQLPDGRWLLAYRFNYQGEQVGIAVSKNLFGPYNNIFNLSTRGEDPFIWSKSHGDGFHTYHILFHVENFNAYALWPSLHAYSQDGFHWNVSKSYDMVKEGAYSTNITWTNGTNHVYFRRERPQILFDKKTGNPLYFYSSLQEHRRPSGHFGYSLSIVQPFAKK